MATKRSAVQMRAAEDSDQDPDYAMVTSMHPPKKQKIHQQDAKDTTVKKIEGIIRKHFALEIKNKEKEIELADERIHQVRSMLDKLRACVVANYYGNAGNYPGAEKPKQKMDLNHPAIQRALGTGDESKQGSEPTEGLLSDIRRQRSMDESTDGPAPPEVKNGDRVTQLTSSSGQGSSRFHVKKRIIVGNVSKYITTDNREESDPSTHKWMVYVRGPPDELRIDHFVKKVWFYLHPSYRPNDLVEVKDPPFHLTRRGWGEFPIRVQLHFNDSRSKKVDIIHHLKLDRTYTGLQTLGAETIVDVELDRYLFDEEGLSGSRPSTPTVTNVNYREGYKAGLSRTPPSLRSSPSVFSTKSSSPLNSDDQCSTPASSPVSGSRETPVMMEHSYGNSSRPTTPSPNLSNKVQIQSGVIVSSSTGSPDHAEGKFVNVLPSSTGASVNPTITKSNRSLQDLPKLSLSSSLTPGLMSTVKKVADGKSALSWRIEEGKLLEVPRGKGASSPRTTITPSLPPPLQATPTASTSLAKPRAKLPSLKVIGPSTTKASTSSSSQMTLLGRQTVKSLLGTQKAPTTSTGALQVVSNSPGAQYYITAKSTDPNLQGKVILIPHQVFAQAQAPGGGKTTTAKSTTKTLGKGKSSFLSPSNVLILPQGSIVPPLPPGSIVQIQQVPSPARNAPNQAKPKTMTNLIRTGITSAKGAIPVVSTSGGSKQAKIVQAVGGAKSPGVSLIPDIKSQLSRTPSGGVILVQRMPTKVANTQVGPGVPKVAMTQRQQQSPLGTVQGQAKQNILLQSPTSPPPPPLVANSGKVTHTTQAQLAKRVLREPAQTLPVPEGTVEITRMLTETIADRKAPLSQMDVIKARNTGPTSYARLPGLSPIKPPGAVTASKGPTMTAAIKLSNAPATGVIQVTAPAVNVKTTVVPVASKSSDSPVVGAAPESLATNDPSGTSVAIQPPEAPLPTTDTPSATTEPAGKPLAVPPNPLVVPPVPQTVPVKEGSDQSRKIAEKPVEETSTPSTSRQAVTIADQNGVEKVTIKTEPIDPDIEPSAVAPLLTSEVLSSIGSSMVVAAAKSSQDEVLKVAVELLVKKEPIIPSTSASGVRSAGMPRLADPTIARLADPTGGVSITESTTPPVVTTPAATVSMPSTPGWEGTQTSLNTPATAAASSSSMAVSSTESQSFGKACSASTEAGGGGGGESSPAEAKYSAGPGMQSSAKAVESTDVGESSTPSLAQADPGSLASLTALESKTVLAEAGTKAGSSSESRAGPSPALQSITIAAASSASSLEACEPMEGVQSSSAPAEQQTQASSTELESQGGSSTNQLSSTQAETHTTAPSMDSDKPGVPLTNQLPVPGEELSKRGNSTHSSIQAVSAMSQSASLPDSELPAGSSPSQSSSWIASAEGHTSTGVDRMEAEQPKRQVISESISALVRDIKKEPVTEPAGDTPLRQVSSTSVDSAPARARTYLDQPGLLRWCAKLNMKRNEHISLYEVKTMEQLIRRIVQVKPLCVEDRNIEELPYGATSIHEFQSWPVGKRRAAEWQRALDIRRMAHRQIHRVVALWNEKVWPTKRIMRWCRKRGYTPGDIDLHHDQPVICNLCGLAYHVNPSESHTCGMKWLSDIGILREPTYSIPDDWCKTLKDQQRSKEKDMEEVVIIDVVTTSPGKGVTPKVEVEEDDGLEPRVYIPPSPGASGVVEEANKLGIHFQSREASERVFAPVVEEMIFTATKQFLTDLLHLSHEQAYDSQSKKRVPTEIHPVHVHQAIRNASSLDFLTNQRIGVLNEIPGSNSDND